MIKDIFNKTRIKELQEQLESQQLTWEIRVNKLKGELSILTQELDSLQAKLTEYEEAETKQLSFPSKKFNISKGVGLLCTSLSDKALAKFCHDFVEELGNSKLSHLTSLHQYTVSKLNRTK